jgi:hypothetical protein
MDTQIGSVQLPGPRTQQGRSLQEIRVETGFTQRLSEQTIAIAEFEYRGTFSQSTQQACGRIDLHAILQAVIQNVIRQIIPACVIV